MDIIIEIVPGSPENVGTGVNFAHDDSKRDFSVFKPVLVNDKYKLLDDPVDILLFGKFLRETDNGQAMIFEGKEL